MSTTERTVYFNGEFIPESQARISIYDSALMFGDMVFEMTRSFNKVHFKLREHLERLYTGIRILQIPVKMSIEEMEEICLETARRNESAFEENDEHRLLIDVTRGLLGIYQGIEGAHQGANIIIADFPLRWTLRGAADYFKSGIEVFIPSQRNIPAILLDPKIKNRSRMHYLMANIEAARYEGKNVWALLLDPDGYITEGTGANFFLVRDNVLYTPEPRNILRGISRAFVMELAKANGIQCVETNLEAYDVHIADEAFFTSTPFCMVPVTRIHGTEIGTGTMGPVFEKLIRAWGERVGVNIIEQILSFSGEEDSGNSPTPYRFKRN